MVTAQRMLLQAVLLLASMLLFDWLIASRPVLSYPFWGPFDTLFHGLLALAIVLPAAVARPLERRSLLVLAFLPATLIDLDHFLANGSLSLAAATSLPCRPWSHSLTFAALAAGAFWIRTHRHVATMAVASALASHVLRDASGGGCTPLLWPFASPAVPYVLYAVLLLGLGAGMSALRNSPEAP